MAIELLTDHLLDTQGTTLIGNAMTAQDAIEKITMLRPDCILLDMHIPGAQGFDLLHYLPEPLPGVIVTTAHPQYALRGYDYSINSFLVKPIELESFQTAIQKVKLHLALQSKMQPLAEKESERFFLKIDREMVGFTAKQVRYIEAMHNYVKLFHGKNVNDFATHRSPLYKLPAQLPLNKFIQVSRQIIVQIDLVERVAGNNVYLYSGEHFDIGVPYRKQLFAVLTSIGKYDTVL